MADWHALPQIAAKDEEIAQVKKAWAQIKRTFEIVSG